MSLRIGVIGVGAMGSAHCRTIAGEVAGAELAAVADADAVVVASSDDTHRAFALACLQASKPVLCEKPLAPTGEASLAVVEAEAALGRRLVQVAFMRRYDLGYRAVKEGLDGGAVGAPLLVHCAHRNAGVPPSYTRDMSIADTAIHEIDELRWLLGTEIVAAQVLTPRRSSRGGELQDPLLVLLEMADGVLVDLEVSVNVHYGYEIRCEVSGETGTVELAEPAPVLLRREGTVAGLVPADWRERF